MNGTKIEANSKQRIEENNEDKRPDTIHDFFVAKNDKPKK